MCIWNIQDNYSLEDAVKKEDGLFTANRFYSVHIHASGCFLHMYMAPGITSVTAQMDIFSKASGHCRTGQIKKAE